MTRYLSEALGAAEPRFTQNIMQLERASGAPSADIRLTADLLQRLRQKVANLGLDPADTTGPELYSALQERLHQDEIRVRQALGITENAPSNEVLSRLRQFLAKLEVNKQCFALKTSVAKRLLKSKPPKFTMKQLGYRSLDSFLKHEAPAQIYAAALVFEGPQWHKNFYDQYAKLTPKDFESKQMTFLCPQSKRWEAIAAEFAARNQHAIVCFRELGTIVMLPVQVEVDGLAITTLLLALHDMNNIRALSSYTKLQQVKPGFGKVMCQSSQSEPLTSAQLAGRPMPWRTIQRYYARLNAAFHPEIFEPHIQPEDLEWHDVENMLSQLDPALRFWQGTEALCMLHDGQPVSLNVLDIALSYCNHLSFAERIVHFVRDNLWHELMLRYLNQHNLEAAVQRQLSQELVEERLPIAE